MGNVLPNPIGLVDGVLQVAHEDLAHDHRAGGVEFPADLGEAVAFGDADAIDLPPEIGEEEAHHVPRGAAQDLFGRGVGVDLGDGGVGLAPAFGLGDFHEQEPLVGKIAVERRFRHAGLTRDLVDACAFEAVPQEDRAGAEPARVFERREAGLQARLRGDVLRIVTNAYVGLISYLLLPALFLLGLLLIPLGWRRYRRARGRPSRELLDERDVFFLVPPEVPGSGQ